MIDRPDTPHADVLLEGIWEDEVTPDDLASRALSAAQASSYAFRVASEGTTATAHLGEVDVADFLESETGKWAQSFIGIVRVGESLVHVSHALGELARSLQQVNLEQSEIVYQVEADIEAAQRHSVIAGIDPTDRITELIAHARARASEVAEKMPTPETNGERKRPAVGLVSGFMAFGRVPGSSAAATERNGRVARNGHAVPNGYGSQNGRAVRNGHEETNGHTSSVEHHEAEIESTPVVEPDAAAAAQDAFADSADDTTMVYGFLSFGRMPSSNGIPRDGAEAAAPEPADVEPADVELKAAVVEPLLSFGTRGVTNRTNHSSADEGVVPVIPQPLVNGFMALGRVQTIAVGGAAPANGPIGAGTSSPSSGPIPIAPLTRLMPIPATPAEIVASTQEPEQVAVAANEVPSESAVENPSPTEQLVDGFLSFGRVPGGVPQGPGVIPTVPLVGRRDPVVGPEEVVDPRGSASDAAEVHVTEASDDAESDDDVVAETDDDGAAEALSQDAEESEVAETAVDVAEVEEHSATHNSGPISLAQAPRGAAKRSGPVKFADLMKAKNKPVAAVGDAPDASPVELNTLSAPVAEEISSDQEREAATPAPVVATGPVILGRSEPLPSPNRLSPAAQQVRDVVASILGSLRAGPNGPDSGFHWAAGLLENETETVMAVATSDAGWLPPGVVIPAGVRVLWNIPVGYRWAAVDDPVRQLIEYAMAGEYTIAAVATTHPSRAYADVLGADTVVGVTRPGAMLPGGRSRFEATVSPARLQHIRALSPEQAERQARALIRDLEAQVIAPEHAIGIEAARLDARCFLDVDGEVPPAVLEQLHSDDVALSDVLGLDRTPASPDDLTRSTPAAARLIDRMLERAIVVATLAAAYHDIESAVYAWTFARFLASQARDAPGAVQTR